MKTNSANLPSLSGQAPGPHTEPHPGPAAPPSVFHDGPINILIVDDEPKNLTVLETVLDDPGYRLVRAESADQALLALVVEEFALLILDIRMPGMTGFELAQMIKERKKTARVPIIFLTAYYNEDQHVLEGYYSGAVDYLHKPVNPAILRSKVSVFAELHRKSRECALANRALLTEVVERRRAEEHLRALTHRMAKAQEAERGSVAVDLHDNITQMLCAILIRSQTLADKLSVCDGASKQDALKLRDMLGTAAEAVERISSNLRPSVLEHLGLAAILPAIGTEFTDRTGVPVKLAGVKLPSRLPINTEIVLFRILQEALINIEQHALAHHVTLSLTQQGEAVQLTIQDDGIGFSPDHHSAKHYGMGGLGLLSMRERAANVDGVIKVISAPGAGTEIVLRIPLPSATMTLAQHGAKARSHSSEDAKCSEGPTH
jgi:signal transduction histidine kinase